MSRFLTEEQKMFRETARRFAETEVEPRANELDGAEEVPVDLIAKAAELGFYALAIPEEYEGLGQNLTTACVVLEEIAKASPAFAGLVNVQMLLCPDAVLQTGNDEQKRRLLPPSAKGERLMAWSMTEPSGAANMGGHQTRLVREGDGYRLNGLKIYTSQGPAKSFLVMAKTERGGQQGYGCVVVDTSEPGLKPMPFEEKLGWRGTGTGTVVYDDIMVDPKNVLGDLLTGNGDLWPANAKSFIGHSATSLGALKGLFAKTVAMIKERTIYGRPMDQTQPVSHWIGEVQCKIEACEAMVYYTARFLDEGGDAGVLSSACKAWVCDTAFEGINKLIQLWGGAAMMNSTGVNRYFRDARVNMIAEGSSEIHLDFVSAAALDRPPFLTVQGQIP